MKVPARLKPWGVGFLCCSVCLTAGTARAADPVIDSVMYQDPVLHVTADHPKLPAGIVDLWLEALKRPEIEFRCRAALALATAHQMGLDRSDRAVPRLRELLEKPGQDAAVQLAAAQALIDLDAWAAAPSLWKQAQAGSDELRRVVEPALARWQYKPAGTVWLERLSQKGESVHSLQLAIRGLVALRVVQAERPLLALVKANDQLPAVRLEAAVALGSIQTSGLESEARQLLADKKGGLTSRLAAVSLLRNHQGAATLDLLQSALHDPEPAVVQAALTRILKLDPKAALPVLDALLANPDARVREDAVDLLFHEITKDRLGPLAQRCADAHPDVRRKARRHLRELAARKEFRPVILQRAIVLLQGKDWRGQEQAAILLSQLKDKAAAPRLVELLQSPRPEVCLAAAWGLRKLAVPATLPAVLAYVRDLHHDVVPTRDSPPTRPAILPVFDAQMCQLVQLLGQSRYQPADPILRTFMPALSRSPRPLIGPETRAAAVWSLGLIHEGRPDPGLTKDLEGKLLALLHPLQGGGDDLRVTRMFAISLARMGAPSSRAALRKFYKESPPVPSLVRSAVAWGLHHLTGETFPPDPPVERLVGGWFLSPVERPNSAKQP